MKSHIVCSVARCSVISEKSQAIIAIRNDLRANSAVTNSKNAGHNNCRERWHRVSFFRIASPRMTSKDRHPFFLSILSGKRNVSSLGVKKTITKHIGKSFGHLTFKIFKRIPLWIFCKVSRKFQEIHSLWIVGVDS